jgi:hypothetical protein
VSTGHELEELPVAEQRETFWWTEFWYEGKCIERHFFLYVWYRDAREFLWDRHYARLSYKFAFWILRNYGNHCPYCKHLIEVAKWEKAFPEVNIEVSIKK